MIRPADLFVRANTAIGRVVVLAAVGLAAGAITRLAGARTVTGLAAVAVGVVAVLRWWPASAVAILLISAALNRFTFPVSGADVKPEHVAVVLVAGVLMLRGLGSALGERLPRARPAPAGLSGVAARIDRFAAVCLVIYLALNALSSLVNAIYPTDSLRLTGLVVLVSLPYFLLPLLVRDGRLLQQTASGWLILCALEAVFGIAIMVLYQRGIDLGVQIVQGSPPVPVGTMREGNIFGSYTAAGAVACLVYLLSSTQARRLALTTIAGALTLGGVVISLARGAWLGLAAGALLVLGLQIRAAARRGLGLALLTVALLPLVLSFSNTPFLDQVSVYITQRLTSLNPDTILNDNTVAERLDTYAKAVDGIGDHPLIGNGTGSFGQRYLYRSVNEPAWVGNLELHLLYDTGIFGLLAFFGCVGGTARLAIRAYRQTRDPARRALLLALGAGTVVLLVAYQATEATWLAFTWVHLGLLRVAGRMDAGG
jgi:O-antigen ligase